MEIQTYATVTRKVIAEEGFAHFHPTACFPARRLIKALEGVPPDAEPERIEAGVLLWAERQAEPGEEFLVAFKIGPTQFKIVRRVGDQAESAVFNAQDETPAS
ncbi:MAG TPA: hypothetical protein ENN42_02830 [Thioalkalivibrio sp.]|nr:hypothetical protein [Thioalkalivibrio sp.]